jgi:hypothetical protein
MVIRDIPDISRTRTNGDQTASKCYNYDTIKLDPRTIDRLRHFFYLDKDNQQDTVTFDVLLNLMDRVEAVGRNLYPEVQS